MATWMVTGANGFVGRHVIDQLRREAAGDRLVALGRTPPRNLGDIEFVQADLEDRAGLWGAIRRIEPDWVVHAAGRTPPATDEVLYRANFWGTDRLLAALRALARPVRVVLVGSAAELGRIKEDRLPVAEDHPCDPWDAYGRSKLWATIAGLAERSCVSVSVARMFNLIGPGSPLSQAAGRFAALLAEPGPGPVELVVGDLEARRDFLDVRDAVRAAIGIALQGRQGRLYHVGSGQSLAVGWILQRLIALSGRETRVRIKPDLVPGLRPGPADSRADISRITSETAWRPMIGLEESLSDLWQSAYAHGELDSTVENRVGHAA